jgi:hypothetical protein
MTAKQRSEESMEAFAERMASKTQYGESTSRNRVYLHPDDWSRIITTLKAVRS